MKYAVPGYEGIKDFPWLECNRGNGVGDEPLARFAFDGRRIEQGQGDRIDGPGYGTRPEGIISEGSQGLGAAIVGEADGHVEKRVANFAVADVQVLVGQKSKELVFNNGSAHSAAESVAVQLGDLHVVWHG